MVRHDVSAAMCCFRGHASFFKFKMCTRISCGASNGSPACHFNQSGRGAHKYTDNVYLGFRVTLDKSTVYPEYTVAESQQPHEAARSMFSH